MLDLVRRDFHTWKDDGGRGVGRNTHLAMGKSNQLVEPNASKNHFSTLVCAPFPLRFLLRLLLFSFPFRIR